MRGEKSNEEEVLVCLDFGYSCHAANRLRPRRNYRPCGNSTACAHGDATSCADGDSTAHRYSTHGNQGAYGRPNTHPGADLRPAAGCHARPQGW